MVFKVQDGIEFATRAEWRNYMMLTYYSFHDIKDAKEPMIKHPGSISGVQFDIINCANSELIVLDSCEQVQIDHVANCKIFIGACRSSIFIRNCENCTIYACCKQLRMRECVNCVNYVYSMAAVHIEESTGLKFACFSGGYPEHEAHLRESELFPPTNNFWYSIYDHNAPTDGSLNWQLFPLSECVEWCPVGKCSPVVPLTLANTSEDVSNEYQVGEAFGIEQMKLDHKIRKNSVVKGEKSSITGASAKPSSVTTSEGTTPSGVDTKASLISTSNNTQEFSFDKKVHQESNKTVRIEELNASKKFQKSPVTPLPEPYMTEDDEVKVNQLGIEIALLVASARAKGIDVAVWLAESPQNKIVPASDFNGRYINLGLAVGMQEDFETKREIDFATDATSLSSIATICSAGFDQDGAPLIDVHSFLMLVQAKVDRFMAQNQNEHEMEVENAAVEEQVIVEEDSPNIEVETKMVDSPKKETIIEEDLPPPPPIVSESIEEPLPRTKEPPKKLSISVRSNSAPPRQRKTNCRDSQNPVLLRGSARQSLSPTSLEETLMKTLKQADMYHRIQVHFGFIKPYIMNLARGRVVVSSPRRWITVHDIQEAFEAGRVHLSVQQAHLVMKKVEEFSAKAGLSAIRTSDNEKELTALEASLNSNSVVSKERVAAVWLKRYLVHLRVGESACDWGTWLDSKLSRKDYRPGTKKTASDRSKEFRKALAGLQHSLSDDEAKDVLKSFDILTPEVLQQVISHQLQHWEFDTSGRRDFTHAVNLRYRKWMMDNPDAFSGKSMKVRQEIEQNAKKEIKQALLNERKQSLLTSEKKNAAITIDLYTKFDAINKKNNYSAPNKFGDWLNSYVATEARHLTSFRECEKQRNKTLESRQMKESWLGSLHHIEALTSKAIKTLKPPMQNERRKSLIAMRRQFLDDSRGSKEDIRRNFLISKKTFNQFFGDDFLTSLENLMREETNNDSASIFFSQKDDAIRSAHDFQKMTAETQSKEYEKWLDEKKMQEKAENDKKNKENIQKKEEEAKKSTKAKKAFKKWKRLHKSNKYFSQAEQKAKSIPEVMRASHNSGWKKELQDPIFEENMI